jgi:hypothetical protein
MGWKLDEVDDINVEYHNPPVAFRGDKESWHISRTYHIHSHGFYLGDDARLYSHDFTASTPDFLHETRASPYEYEKQKTRRALTADDIMPLERFSNEGNLSPSGVSANWRELFMKIIPEDAVLL